MSWPACESKRRGAAFSGCGPAFPAGPCICNPRVRLRAENPCVVSFLHFRDRETRRGVRNAQLRAARVSKRLPPYFRPDEGVGHARPWPSQPSFAPVLICYPASRRLASENRGAHAMNATGKIQNHGHGEALPEALP